GMERLASALSEKNDPGSRTKSTLTSYSPGGSRCPFGLASRSGPLILVQSPGSMDTSSGQRLSATSSPALPRRYQRSAIWTDPASALSSLRLGQYAVPELRISRTKLPSPLAG